MATKENEGGKKGKKGKKERKKERRRVDGEKGRFNQSTKTSRVLVR